MKFMLQINMDSCREDFPCRNLFNRGIKWKIFIHRQWPFNAMHEFVFVYDVYLYTITGKWIYRKQDTRRDLCCKWKANHRASIKPTESYFKRMRCKCVYDGNIYEGWRSFERKEVKLWLNHEKNYDLKSNFMFEENTIKIDWRTISEHLKKRSYTQ